MKQKTVRRIILCIIYALIALFAAKIGQGWRLSPGADFAGKAIHVVEGLKEAFSTLAPTFYIYDLVFGVSVALFVKIAVLVRGRNAKKFRKNEEYGSARWGAYYQL